MATPRIRSIFYLKYLTKRILFNILNIFTKQSILFLNLNSLFSKIYFKYILVSNLILFYALFICSLDWNELKNTGFL